MEAYRGVTGEMLVRFPLSSVIPPAIPSAALPRSSDPGVGGQISSIQKVVQADLANATDVGHLVKEAVDTFGAIDVVVNCAGMMPLRPITGGTWRCSIR
jgi:NAD(P)-dependent dehydrogenase (short-subunit alcohol dehydrogenase family)